VIAILTAGTLSKKWNIKRGWSLLYHSYSVLAPAIHVLPVLVTDAFSCELVSLIATTIEREPDLQLLQSLHSRPAGPWICIDRSCTFLGTRRMRSRGASRILLCSVCLFSLNIFYFAWKWRIPLELCARKRRSYACSSFRCTNMQLVVVSSNSKSSQSPRAFWSDCRIVFAQYLLLSLLGSEGFHEGEGTPKASLFLFLHHIDCH